jgi:8-oxo-dGTP diphosphatase
MSPLRVTCALIERDQKVLVAQRPEGKALAGKWEFPGGKLDETETPESCLAREILEELGCEIEITSALSPVLHSYPNGMIQLIPFRCEIKCGAPQALEHQAIQWMDPVLLSHLDLAEADRPILREYLEIRSA